MALRQQVEAKMAEAQRSKKFWYKAILTEVAWSAFSLQSSLPKFSFSGNDIICRRIKLFLAIQKRQEVLDPQDQVQLHHEQDRRPRDLPLGRGDVQRRRRQRHREERRLRARRGKLRRLPEGQRSRPS